MGQLALHATISGSSQPLARSSAAVPPWLRKHLSQHFHTSSTLPQSGDSRTGGSGGGKGSGGIGGRLSGDGRQTLLQLRSHFSMTCLHLRILSMILPTVCWQYCALLGSFLSTHGDGGLGEGGGGGGGGDGGEQTMGQLAALHARISAVVPPCLWHLAKHGHTSSALPQ